MVSVKRFLPCGPHSVCRTSCRSSAPMSGVPVALVVVLIVVRSLLGSFRVTLVVW